MCLTFGGTTGNINEVPVNRGLLACLTSRRMFQRQPAPYTPFSSYGGATDQDQEQSAYNYQSSGLGLGSGGPIEFDNPVFSPISSYRALPLNPQHNRYGAMAAQPSDDLAAQEALARSYQPELTVSISATVVA